MVFGLVAGAFLARLQFGEHSSDHLPTYGTIPAFSLQDATGGAFQSESMRGKVWTLNFFFTSCPAVCPAVMGRLSSIGITQRTDESFRLVSITVDPETDDAETLQKYGERLGADGMQWLFLTGELDAIRALRANSLKLDSGEEVDLHTTRVLLIDKQGQIRGFYQGVEDASMKQLQRDIQLLIAE